MKLIRLEMLGFKSFLHRTVLHFEDGITCIVGPNGCGKSNIVDAITWVLGERGTKSLRVKDMGDVIFHGSDGKRPVNVGEVTIDLQDGDKDFSVRRRIYRDGVNEYSLNGAQVRLKDIQDFFLGTGIGVNTYAIVEQGRIEQFITMKPQERRLLIEEASGITRFEEKKREAMARMEEVKANLDRVEDIQKEVESGFGRAHEEWQRWKEYRALSERLAAVEMEILADGWRRIQKRSERLEERRRDLDRERAQMDEAAQSLSAQITAKEEEFALSDTVVRELEVNLKALEKDLEGRLLEVDHVGREEAILAEEKKVLLQECKEMEEKRGRIGQEVRELKERSAGEAARLADLERQAGEAKAGIDSLSGRLVGLDGAVEAARERLFVTTSALSETRNRIADAERQRLERRRREEHRLQQKGALQEKVRSLESKLEPKKTLRAELDEACRQLTEREEEALARRDGLQAELGEAKRLAMEASSDLKAKKGFLRQIEAETAPSRPVRHEGRRLMDLITFRDDFERSLERFFVMEMEYGVIDALDAGAVARIAEERPSNYVFFPPEGTFALEQGRVKVGVIQVDSVLDALRRIWGGEEGLFAAGDVLIDSRGFILGEKEGRGRAIERFASRLKMEREVKGIEKTLQGHASAVEELSAQATAAGRTWEEVKVQRQAKARALDALEREIIALTTELRTQSAALVGLDAAGNLEAPEETGEDSSLADALAGAAKERQGAEEALNVARKERETFKSAYEKERSRWHALSVDLERIKGHLRGVTGELARKEEEQASLQKELVRRGERLRFIDNGMAERVLKREGLERQYEAMRVSLDGEVHRYEALKGGLADLHMEKTSLADRRNVLLAEKEHLRGRQEQVEKELAVLGEKVGVIEDRLKTVYGIEDIAGLKPSGNKQLEEERESLKGRIDGLGEVNFRAEKEYGELAERRVFLQKQRADLEESVEALKKSIARIDALSKDKFLETFETINGAFKRYVPLLFKGGRGNLALSSETAGVELYAQPPGKRVVRMELLSGGEKALVSLSFLLSLMDTRPSPFSLLDEIDAPLDDANLAGLMDIMRDMSRKTQILFITHNRITMTSSNALHGVTMEEDGVSKIVSVRL